jgi:hypothetical protein
MKPHAVSVYGSLCVYRVDLQQTWSGSRWTAVGVKGQVSAVGVKGQGSAWTS